jgi:phenylalanyl-tRNA synthetase alpha subunit
MTEDNNIEANAALMLDEKIKERIYLAVGELFGHSPGNNVHVANAHGLENLRQIVRDFVTRELFSEVARGLGNDPQFVERLFSNMLHIQRSRQDRYYLNNRHDNNNLFF